MGRIVKYVGQSVLAITLAFLTTTQNCHAIEYVNVHTSGTKGTTPGNTDQHGISSTGRYVIFDSTASTLVDSDTNGNSDVFVRDTESSTTIRASLTNSGGEGNAESRYGDISSDGRYVVFYSSASNLVTGDTNSRLDIFLRDTQSASTTRISVSSDGTQGNDHSWGRPFISDNGRYVVFSSDATNLVANDSNGRKDAFLRDTQTNTTIRVSVADDESEGNHDSYVGGVSNDGRYVLFYSTASNLVPNDTNNGDDVFIRDVQTGSTTRVSVSSTGVQGNSTSNTAQMSTDGRYVAFISIATNLVANDTNATQDIFLRDTVAGTTVRASLDSSGAQFSSASLWPTLSDDGRYVTFTNQRRYVRDLLNGTTMDVERNASGQVGNSYGNYPKISGNGEFLSFISNSSNLVSGDTVNTIDLFHINTSCVFDTDEDGTFDCSDGCLTDPAKSSPGVCGCGNDDIDADSDTIYRIISGSQVCIDECDNDSSKTVPGQCGCGVAETDSDSDGTADCNDECDSDSSKTIAGQCGCGIPDTDTDSDGTANCNDDCPTDSSKISEGFCGCGAAETDTDSDNTPDCIDSCVNDPNKTAAGICGCGVSDLDSDNDGTANCNDLCPDDSNKTAQGQCGCGNVDTDSDSDGTADCNDACPSDSAKTSLGTCGCGVPDTDSDSDGIADCNETAPTPVSTTPPTQTPPAEPTLPTDKAEAKQMIREIISELKIFVKTSGTDERLGLLNAMESDLEAILDMPELSKSADKAIKKCQVLIGRIESTIHKGSKSKSAIRKLSRYISQLKSALKLALKQL